MENNRPVNSNGKNDKCDRACLPIKLFKAIVMAVKRAWYGDQYKIRVFAATLAIYIGIFVVLPFDTTTPPFVLLSKTIPESIWGWAMIVLGLCEIVAADCYQKESCGYFDEVICLISIAIWAYLGIITAMSQAESVLVVIYNAFAIVWVVQFLQVEENSLWYVITVPVKVVTWFVQHCTNRKPHNGGVH